MARINFNDMKRIIFLLALAIFGIAAQAADKLRVVATLPDLGAIAAEVGGAAITVNTLAQPSEDPHFVDPKPSFAKLLNKADLLIEGGADLEIGWLPPLVQNARNPKILFGQPGRVVASEGIEMKEWQRGPVDRSLGDVHPLGNPHYLMDPLNAPIVARNFAERFGKLQPVNAAMFHENATALEKNVSAHMTDWNRTLGPLKGVKVITYHRTFTYFMDRFGLELFDTIEPKPGIEPSPSHIAGLINRAKTAGVKIVLVEENRPRKTPERIANEIGAQLVVVKHMPESGAAGKYIEWISGLVETVGKAGK
jgi:zinc/manganese transport system substrate-binding protein